MKDQQYLRSMHEVYCTLTGFRLPFTMEMDYPWGLFAAEFTIEDLTLVIKSIKDHKAHGLPSRSLLFRNFISGPNSIQYFREDLAEAHAVQRNRVPKPTQKDKVLGATGRKQTKPLIEAQTTAQIMEQHSLMAKLLKEYRQTL